jgi:hypothetical protein
MTQDAAGIDRQPQMGLAGRLRNFRRSLDHDEDFLQVLMVVGSKALAGE